MIRAGTSGTLSACRSSSSSTDTPRPSARLRSPPGQASRARSVTAWRRRRCLAGGHALWWRVQADDARSALELLPAFVARRTVPIEIRDVEIP